MLLKYDVVDMEMVALPLGQLLLQFWVITINNL
jgi:hypothetical protein